MASPFIGEIMMFGGNFAPRNWAFCDGQILSIAQNTALFSLLGTTYGGDGRTTFALPDLRGRIPIHVGAGPGLSGRSWGQKGGQESVTLTTQQLPSHQHTQRGTDSEATSADPTDGLAAKAQNITYNSTGSPVDMNAASSGNTGGSQPHNNMQPYLCVNFVIALLGVFPSRN
jgi:microcystin-dependent protein